MTTKERPIPFSGPMVRAILEGRKTQTRRLMKPQPERDPTENCGVWYPSTASRRKSHYANEDHFRQGMPADWSPFGKPGDRLWVRETWGLANACYDTHRNTVNIGYRATGPNIYAPENWSDEIEVGTGLAKRYYFELLNEIERATGRSDYDGDGCRVFRWRSPINMPRWASRITLEVTDVRVERLQDITEADAIAEGFASVAEFAAYWDTLNAKRSPWARNDWLWVYGFKVLTPAAVAAKEDERE